MAAEEEKEEEVKPSGFNAWHVMGPLFCVISVFFAGRASVYWTRYNEGWEDMRKVVIDRNLGHWECDPKEGYKMFKWNKVETSGEPVNELQKDHP